MTKSTTERRTGTIAAILSMKQFGFIDAGEDKDLFFHHTGVSDEGGFSSLKPGMQVSFVVLEGERGLKATGVERVRE